MLNNKGRGTLYKLKEEEEEEEEKAYFINPKKGKFSFIFYSPGFYRCM